VAVIGGNQYTLSSIANLTACGFDPTQSTIAMAVSESGAILVGGGKQSNGVNDEFRISCLLTPTASVNGTPQYRASPQTMVSVGLNSAGTVVGATCPSGFALGGIEEPCFNLAPIGTPSFEPSTAVAVIGGNQYTLSSIANLTACGFDSTQSTIAMAVSESGAILVEGGKQSNGVNDEFRISCLLTPTAPVNGVPAFVVAPL
jgi:hypothetical protein